MWRRRKKRAEREMHGGIGEGRRVDALPPDAMAQIWSVTHVSSLWTDGFYGACSYTHTHTHTHTHPRNKLDGPIRYGCHSAAEGGKLTWQRLIEEAERWQWRQWSLTDKLPVLYLIYSSNSWFMSLTDGPYWQKTFRMWKHGHHNRINM